MFKVITFGLGVIGLTNAMAYNQAYDKAEELKKLSPIQYYVTQQGGREKPFNNLYWNNKEEGIYVDIVSGEPLFSSLDKFDSGTGWPSFTKPISTSNLFFKTDRRYLLALRTKVISKSAKTHLGHVFKDGSKSTGLRYCLNSAALKFIPKEQMSQAGYGDLLYIFDTKNNH